MNTQVGKQDKELRETRGGGGYVSPWAQPSGGNYRIETPSLAKKI